MLGSHLGAKGPNGAMCPRSSHPREQKAPARLHELSKRHGGHEQCVRPRGHRCQEPPGKLGHRMGQAPPSPFPSCFPRCPPVLPSPPRLIPGPGEGRPRGQRGEPRGGAGRCPGAPGAVGRAPRSTEPPGTVPSGGGPRCPPVPSVPPPPLPGPGSRRRCGGTESGVRENESESLRRAFAFASPARSRGHRGAGPDAGFGARWRSRGRP